MRRHSFFAALLGLAAIAAPKLQASPPDHVVVVILENKAYGLIIGNPEGPNINALAAAGALFVPAPNDPTGVRSGSHAVRHPSQPNYLELFSGSNQGVVQDGLPGSTAEPLSPALPFNTPNLAANLLKAGYTFAIYSEDLPSVGFNGEHASDDPALDKYERKHNPAVNWQSTDALANNHLPPSINQPFRPLPNQPGTGFPTSDFSKLPKVSFVIPNEQHNMHDGSIAMSDTWLKENIIDTYLAWAQTHNSLLILTFDEDNFDNPTKPSPTQTTNLITTIFAGPMVKPGQYPELDLNASKPDVRPPDGFVTPTNTAMNHWNVLSTIEDFYGLPHVGGSIGRPPITDVFTTPLAVAPVVVPNAQTGAQGDVGNLFPLFSAKPLRYQQVFAASDFARFAAGGEQINSIAFRVHAPSLPFTGAVQQLQVNLSTTPKAPDALSTVFAENIGSKDTQVFSGPLQVAATSSTSGNGPQSFDIAINFTTPFVYDPANGNLLVDIRNVQGGTQNPPLEQELDASSVSGDAVSRVFNYGDVNATAAGKTGAADEIDTLGLVTQFGTSANPAPSPSPSPTPTGTVGPNSLFANSSTRARTGAGDRVMIGGFIVKGAGKKQVVVRGLGPSVNVNGSPVAGTLQDPVLTLNNSSGVIATNDDWKQTQRAELEASGLAPRDDREAAILMSLDAGNYTAVVSGKQETSGIALVEVYDVAQTAPAKLFNIATRGYVETGGDNVMIAGFIIGGPDSARTIVRGLGPSINVSGRPVPGTLPNPTIELYNANGVSLGFNDDWQQTQRDAIQASGLAPTNEREAAIISDLAPGFYTAILREKDATPGIGLVEAYKLN